MANEFEFLDKHFYETSDPQLAAQAAAERFGNYPQASASTVIYGITWKDLLERIQHAVINFTYMSTIFNTPAIARLTDYHGQPQWIIFLMDVNFVEARMQQDPSSLTTSYAIENYEDGVVILRANVIQLPGGVTPLLGEIVHLDPCKGRAAGAIPLKNYQ